LDRFRYSALGGLERGSVGGDVLDPDLAVLSDGHHRGAAAVERDERARIASPAFQQMAQFDVVDAD
jgi:hypothetical protein